MKLFKSYDEEHRYLLRHLIENWEMKEQYARAFVDTYKKDMGKKMTGGRKIAKQFRASKKFPGATLLSLDFEDPNLAVVCQAYVAYMKDLRKGKFVGSNVEKAIWAILANRSDLVEEFDRPFATYIDEEYEKTFPDLFEQVFEDDREVVNTPSSTTQIENKLIIECQSCRRSLRVPMEKSGKIRCPACKIVFEVST